MNYRLPLFTTIIASLASLSSLLATDFSPQVIRQTIDGPNPRHYFFKNGERKVIFRIDSLSAIMGSSSGCQISFSDQPRARIGIAASPLKPGVAFDKEAAKYDAAAPTFLPGGCTDVVLEGKLPNPYPINDWKSCQYVYTYNFHGKAFRSSIAFLNYNASEQWMIHITADSEDYQKAAERASRVLNSMDDRPVEYQSQNAPS